MRWLSTVETTNFQDGGKENSIEKPKAKPRGGGSCLNSLLMLLPEKTGNLYWSREGSGYIWLKLCLMIVSHGPAEAAGKHSHPSQCRLKNTLPLGGIHWKVSDKISFALWIRSLGCLFLCQTVKSVYSYIISTKIEYAWMLPFKIPANRYMKLD